MRIMISILSVYVIAPITFVKYFYIEIPTYDIYDHYIVFDYWG